jgi:hypothetical protein
MLAEINRGSGNTLFRRSGRSKLNLFFKVYGSASIRSELERGIAVASIVGLWREDVTRFRSERASYLLY